MAERTSGTMLISTEKFEMLVLRDQHYKLEQGKDKIFDMILGSEDTSSQKPLDQRSTNIGEKGEGMQRRRSHIMDKEDKRTCKTEEPTRFREGKRGGKEYKTTTLRQTIQNAL